MDKVYCVYTLTSERNTVIYAGVTGNLGAAGVSAPGEAAAGFTNRYNLSKLVYYEAGYDASGAIAREKQTKAGSRQKKIDVINGSNPEWRDLYDDL